MSIENRKLKLLKLADRNVIYSLKKVNDLMFLGFANEDTAVNVCPDLYTRLKACGAIRKHPSALKEAFLHGKQLASTDTLLPEKLIDNELT